MGRLRFVVVAVAVALCALVAAPYAQVAAPQSPAVPPELALDRTLPIDPAVRTGQLPNGLK